MTDSQTAQLNELERDIAKLHSRMAAFPQVFPHSGGFPELRQDGSELQICWPDLNVELFKNYEWDNEWQACRSVTANDLDWLQWHARYNNLDLLERGYRPLYTITPGETLYFVFWYNRYVNRADWYKMVIFDSEREAQLYAAKKENRIDGVCLARVKSADIDTMRSQLGLRIEWMHLVNPVGTAEYAGAFSVRWLKDTPLQQEDEGTRRDIERGRALWEEDGYYWHGSLLLRKEDASDDNR